MVRKIRSREEETGRPEIGMDCVWLHALARCVEQGRLSAGCQSYQSLLETAHNMRDAKVTKVTDPSSVSY